MREITVSAPGSLIVCGEHAVVYGYRAIVCAVEQRVFVTLRERTDDAIQIFSALGNHETTISTLAPHPKLSFVMTAIAHFKPLCGFELHIQSEINPTFGLGSSAAVTVATVTALATFCGMPTDILSLHPIAHSVVLAVQKRGSGADLAASLQGGMVAYRPAVDNSAVTITPLPIPQTVLSMRYAGYKTPTADVLALLAERAISYPERYAQLYQDMGAVCERAITANMDQNWGTFYAELIRYQYLMTDLGVCDEVQASHFKQARETIGNQAAKISGSGLGDCIIAFGNVLPHKHTAVEISKQGVLILYS